MGAVAACRTNKPGCPLDILCRRRGQQNLGSLLSGNGSPHLRLSALPIYQFESMEVDTFYARLGYYNLSLSTEDVS